MVIDWKGYGITSGTILTFVGRAEDLSEQNRSPS
jgi:hypothetical protein